MAHHHDKKIISGKQKIKYQIILLSIGQWAIEVYIENSNINLDYIH